MAAPKKKLRSGFTTGTAAAAAVKGGLRLLVDGRAPDTVHIDFLSAGGVTIPIERVERRAENKAICTVIKDAGDDPDVTHRAEIGAEVELVARAPSSGGPVELRIEGGEGVGTVTKPGLEVPPGSPAINPGPRRMIRAAVDAVLTGRGRAFDVRVRIFVPRGEILARKTLNARLGILGGISILGTTGIVRPMSHAAYTATIRSALSVAAASGRSTAVLTTGRRSERFAQAALPDLAAESFVQIGDYFRFALEAAAALELKTIVLAVFFGKALKMAQGIPHTHAARAALVLERLAEWTRKATGDDALVQTISDANTARQAFEILKHRAPLVLDAVARRIVHAALNFAQKPVVVRCILFDYDGRIACDSDTLSREEQ
ncbi:MAG: cobalt-precorrin-5B (C(1))-methyltransferase CbiD [Desulfobacterales bacterium]|nr:cobalt-precorrin-5B (C(1))-methyltransferase CbiD [Desulfobacterales bacterium]MDJ0988766.1 cobalt-precorrin-5B (C(1))-methyltransferase CbiD [Desulfobacterales bacterium]